MSKICVPVIINNETHLFEVKCTDNDGELMINGISPHNEDNDPDSKNISSLVEKIEKVFNKSTQDIHAQINLINLKNPDISIQFDESTQSITLGIICVLEQFINKRIFKDNYDLYIISGDIKVENSILLKNITDMEKKSAINVDSSTMFFYVSNEEVKLKNTSKIRFFKYDDTEPLKTFFYDIFKENFSSNNSARLKANTPFFITKQFIEVRKQLLNSDANHYYLFTGQSNSGKTIFVHSLVNYLISMDLVKDTIWISIDNQEISNLIKSDLNKNLENKEEGRGNIQERTSAEPTLLKKIANYLEKSFKKYNIIEEQFALVIDNIELDFVDEIAQATYLLLNKYKNIRFTFLTSWLSVKNDQLLQKLSIKKIPIGRNDFEEFTGIYENIVNSEYISPFEKFTEENKKELLKYLYESFKDKPGNIPIVLSSLKDIEFSELITKLKDNNINPIKKESFFYNLSFDRVSLFSQIILYAFLGNYGCNNKTLKKSEIENFRQKTSNCNLIKKELITEDSIKKALQQLSFNHIINENGSGDFYIKNDTLRHFLFEADNRILLNKFVQKEQSLSISIQYDWFQEFEKIIEENIQLIEGALFQLASNAKSSRLFDSVMKYNIDINQTDEKGWSPIHFACRYNTNLDIFKFLIKNATNYQLKTNHNLSILHLSMLNENEEVAKYILEHKLYNDINEVDKNNATPLLIAAEFSKTTEIIELLIKNKANINAVDKEGNSILHYAIRNEKIEILEYILKLDIDKYKVDNEGRNALLKVISHTDNVEKIKLLLKEKIDITSLDNDDCCYLHYGAQNESLEIISYLLDNFNYYDINKIDKYGYPPLFYAVLLSKNLEVVKLLLEKGADSEYIIGNDNILNLAARNSEISILDYFLEHEKLIFRDKINEWGSPIHYAIKDNPNENILHIFQKHSISFEEKTSDNLTLLHLATMNPNSNMIKFLLRHHLYNNINELDNEYNTPILLAAKNNNYDAVKALLNAGADYKKKNTNGKSLLHFAIENENLELTQFLILNSLYTDINEEDADGFTPLLLAILYNKDFDIINFLMDYNIDYDHKTKDGKSILHCAAASNNCKMLKEIIRKGWYTDINEKDKFGFTPLLRAVFESSDLEIIEFLIDKGASVSEKTYEEELSLLHLACENPDLNVLKFLIRKKYVDLNDLDSEGNNAFHYIISYNDNALEFVKYLEEKKCNLVENNKKQNILHIATLYSKYDVLEHILEKKLIDINKKDIDSFSPLFYAVGAKSENTTGDINCLKILLNFNADYNIEDSNKMTILDWALFRNNQEIIQYLLENHLYKDINHRNIIDSSPLLIALEFCTSLEIIKSLFDIEQIDPSIINKEGENILHLASYNPNEEILKYVLDKNIYDISTKNNIGDTPLLIATQNTNNPLVIKLLIEAGSDIKYRNKDKKGIIHCAASNEEIQILKCIIEKYFYEDIFILDVYGKNALHYAAEKGFFENFKYLIEIGLNPNEEDFDGNPPINYVPDDKKSEFEEYIKNITRYN